MPKQPAAPAAQNPEHVVDQSVEAVNAAPNAAPAPSAEPDYDAVWNGLPEDARSGIERRFYDRYNQALESDYGDLVALARETQSNPKLKDALKEFASDAELRNFIADGGTIEQLRSLQKDEAYREFLFKDATEAYRKYPQPNAQSTVDPVMDRIGKLESQFEERDNRQAFQGYVSSRQAEVEALRNAAPDLRDNQALLSHIVTQAENNFKIAAANSGININQPDEVWAAQAVRRGIRPPAYLDVHRQYQSFAGRTPPPAAPSNATPARQGRGLQAPRTRVEAASKDDAAARKAQAIAAMKKNTERALSAVK